MWSKSNEQVNVRNFVGKCWVSDSETDRLLDVANKQYSDTVCFAHKPNKHLCAVTQIQKKLETIFSSGTNIKRILIALHVGSEDDGSTFISHDSKQGNHWSLLAIDIENKSAYYGDSLAWAVPHNLICELGDNLLMLEDKLGIDVYKILSPFINLVVVTTDT